jgi:hypothetical protein
MVVGLLVLAWALPGCAVVKATKQPGKKDLSVLNKGTSRGYVIAELGPPAYSEEKNGEKSDFFSFKQGYSKGAKTGRALFHGTADLFTLGLWEIVGTPAESAADGTDVKVQILYDKDEKVQEVKVLQGEKAFKKKK